MTKSQNTKNEQQKDLCITSEQLTSQWKKGELPEGFYWVKVKEEFANYPILADCVRRYEYYDVYTYFPEYEDSITSVLAPVPSYEEWQDLKSKLQLKETAYDFDTARLEEQNAQLKELLKWCRDELFEVYSNEMPHHEDAPIIKKLDEVLK